MRASSTRASAVGGVDSTAAPYPTAAALTIDVLPVRFAARRRRAVAVLADPPLERALQHRVHRAGCAEDARRGPVHGARLDDAHDRVRDDGRRVELALELALCRSHVGVDRSG